MKKMISTAAVALLFSAVAIAAVHTATWTKATRNTDGSTIPATGPGSVTTTVEYGTCNGDAFGTRIGDVVTASTGTTAPTPNLSPGTYCFRARHENTYGETSDWSAVVKLVEAAPKPNPPTGFTIGQ